MAAVAERQEIVNENVEEVQAGPYPIDSLVVSVKITYNRVAILLAVQSVTHLIFVHF